MLAEFFVLLRYEWVYFVNSDYLMINVPLMSPLDYTTYERDAFWGSFVLAAHPHTLILILIVDEIPQSLSAIHIRTLIPASLLHLWMARPSAFFSTRAISF